VTNTAVATATGPKNDPVASQSSSATVTATQTPGLSLVKKADRTVVHAAGDTLGYTFTVTNTGNVTLHEIAIAEKSFSGTGHMSPINCPTTTLPPKAVTVCTATYHVTTADMSASAISNTAVASGFAGPVGGHPDAVDSATSNALVRVDPPSTSPPTGGGPGGGLPSTGAGNLAPLLKLALMLLIAGTAMLVAGRRRHG
jgi:hypothetical protein